MQSDFLYLVEIELASEREQDPQPIAAKWQAYGMVSGGLSRLLDELQSPSLDPKAGMLARLLDIAAICYRAAEDLQLLEVEMTQEFVEAVIAKHMPADVIPICNSAQEEDYYRELRLKSAIKEGEL